MTYRFNSILEARTGDMESNQIILNLDCISLNAFVSSCS